MQGVPNLNEGVPMYDKARVYNGMSEFSFEEIRASRYWMLRRKREEEQEKGLSFVVSFVLVVRLCVPHCAAPEH